MRLTDIIPLLLLVPVPAFAGPSCSIVGGAGDSSPGGTPIDYPVGSRAPTSIPDTEIASTPALKRIASAGAQLLDLGTEHGLRGVFAKSGANFQVFYLTPDGNAVVGGVMWDGAGQNLTRQQVAPIDGAIPTVTIGRADEAAPKPGSVASPLTLVAETIHGTSGDPKAPELWMFIDPMCSYSVRALAQIEPFVATGRVRLSVIPISILDYEDGGQSTAKSRVMVSRPPAEMVDAWQKGVLSGDAAPDADAKLAANLAIANAIDLKSTPLFLWRTKDGGEGRLDGIPNDIAALTAAIGG